MKNILAIVVLLFSISAMAQSPSQPKQISTSISYEQVKNAADIIRSHREEIRRFFLDMSARKVEMDIAATLKKNHMAEADIQNVLSSDQVKLLIERFEKTPEVQNQVDKYVTNLLQPGVIEAYVMKQREQLEKQIEGDVVIARSELRKSGSFREREEVFIDQDQRSFAKKLWDHLVNDLYQD